MFTESERQFDVAIAGAGPAGASLALDLARRGARVALLDAATFPRDKLCGEYLSPESWNVFDRLDVFDEIVRSGYQAIRFIRITTPKGRVVEAEASDRHGRSGVGLSRYVLDSMMLQKARAAGVVVFEGSRVGGCIVRDGCVTGLYARHPSLGRFELEAKITVAADGRHSALVRQTGHTRVRSFFRPRLVGLKRHYELSESSTDEFRGTVGLYVVPGGYGGTCCVDGKITNVCALVPERELRRCNGNLDRLDAEYLGRNRGLRRLLATGSPVTGWKTVAGVRVEVSAPRLPGIVYVGDCHGTIDPLGGQGITIALLGAEMLSPLIADALGAGSAFDRPFQSTWQAVWRHRFDRRVHLCRVFHHALVNPALIDFAACFGAIASRLLGACYRQTRDPGWLAS
jgi:flavin-dependent dehydrogenase